MNEEGETVVLFPEETQSGAENQNAATLKNQTGDNTVDVSGKKDDDSKKNETEKKDSDSKKEETDNKQDTKKDPEKQPNQKDPEITQDSLSELPMVPFED